MRHDVPCNRQEAVRTRCRFFGVLVLAVVAALGCPQPTWALRPLATEDPSTVGAGALELEVGAEYTTDEGEEGGVAGKLTLGVLSWFDVSFETGVLAVAPPAERVRVGVTDSTLLLKAVWAGLGARPALGAVMDLRLPTGDPDRALGEPGTDVSLIGIAGQEFGPVAVFANVGYTFITDEGSLDTWLFSGAVTTSATERLLAMGEITSTVGVDRAEDEVLARLGLAHATAEWVQVDLGIGVGLNRAAPDVVVTAGVTIPFR